MAGVIKAGQLEARRQREQSTAIYTLEDIQKRGDALLEEVRQQASGILKQAKQDAESIRAQALEEAREQARREAVETVRAEMATQAGTLLPALEQMLHELQLTREEWVARWNRAVLELAAAIAEKIVRRELEKQPEISVELLREALEMASGAKQIQLRLNPQDLDSLGQVANHIASQFEPLGQTALSSDADIEPGFCRILTEFGEIDQSLATQLQRIVEELE